MLAALALLIFPSVLLLMGDRPLADTRPLPAARAVAPAAKVYGEWRIRVRPDKGQEYRRLIETKGLPLFRKAGGRMVGWWNTQIGNLYEHLTIWEYDDMTAFERAGQILGKDRDFARFVALRDPLLTGEESRFLRLASFAEKPKLPDPAAVVVHEIHHVKHKDLAAYLRFMEKEGLPVIKKHGFRPVGPWLVEVGKWSEVTYLFRWDSLADRQRRIARFSAHGDAKTWRKVYDLVDDITTRLLTPTPFRSSEERPKPRRAASGLLPHLEEIARGVFAAGFANRFADANCGWVALNDGTLLVDLPRGVAVPKFLAEVERIAGKPVRKLALTHFQPEDARIAESLMEHGVTRIVASPGNCASLRAASKKVTRVLASARPSETAIGDRATPINFLPLDGIVPGGGAAVHLPGRNVLFAGPLVVHGPRSKLPGTDTALWIAALRKLERLAPRHVVPAFGSWAGGEALGRQRRFLTELRRQVGYVIARGRPKTALAAEVRIPSDYLLWMPYDNPTAEDIAHVYQELTIPAAPFNGRPPRQRDRHRHALVLIGDEPHEPGHIEEGLRPVFEATGVVPHFAVDVKALSADNLAKVGLLVVLRDGLQRPQTGPKSEYVWMTLEQERAVVDFVKGGGGVLCLHNALGLYPAGGSYLKLMGGRYTGHGPLERFRVEVKDQRHPITRGVRDFSTADEQHAPEFVKDKVHLLLQGRSDQGKVTTAGWVLEPGRGRVCYLANGHTREALLHPMYQLLMRNAVRWCLRLEEGAARRSRSRK
jgi:type 1 glutamine amidotransferase